MTTDLEDRIRTSLHRRADAIHVEAPEPDLVRPFAPPRRSRRIELVAVAAALVLFVGAGLLVALAGRDGPDAVNGGPGAPSGSVPVAPVVGELGRVVEPGALVAMPSPWRMDRFTFVSASSIASERVGVLDGTEQGVIAPATMVEYGFTDGTHTLQLDFYETGRRSPQVTTPEPPLVDVRGTTGYFLDYGGGRYRVQWDEGGRTWEVDGYGFTSLDEVVAMLATIEWQDDATWAAGAPAHLADAIAENPAGSVTWSVDDGAVRAASGCCGVTTTTTLARESSAGSELDAATATTVESATTTSVERVVTTEVPAGPPSTTTTVPPPPGAP